MQKIFKFLKSQIVLVAAWILAVISAFFVHPNKEYFSYIDWRTLGILWSLMVIMLGFRLNGVFEKIGNWLLSKVHTVWQLSLVLVLLCFFFSMLITNDVSLITFVPFTILILQKIKKEKLMIPVIVLQTVAANLGSMLTPIGNPQNLYLFGLGGFGLWDFIKLMLPYSSLSLVLLLVSVLILASREKQQIGEAADNGKEADNQSTEKNTIPVYKLIIFCLLFILSILTVLHFVKFYILAAVTLVCMLIFERKAILKADYFLLLTFAGFFIFTGNMSRVPAVNDFLQKAVGGRELLFGVVCSQVISNVPASLLLSGFSKNLSGLIVGVNLGGLGTLIASMASLISYKFYAVTENAKTGKYLLLFTLVNVIFLALLLAEAAVILK